MFHEPFLKNSELERLVQVKTSYLPTKQEKAERLFKWMRKNIEYDYEKSEEEGISYRNSLETYYDRKGLCGEQTYLYVVLARIAGIEAWFEYVEETIDNKEHHACAGVKLEDRVVYVDTTYGDFGIQHNKSSRMSDKEAARHYFLSRREYAESGVSLSLLVYAACFIFGFLARPFENIELKPYRVMGMEVDYDAVEDVQRFFPLDDPFDLIFVDENKDKRITRKEMTHYIRKKLEEKTMVVWY